MELKLDTKLILALVAVQALILLPLIARTAVACCSGGGPS